MEALDAPYLQVGLLEMIRKRAGWLSALFLGEMLTATAMALLRARDRPRGGAGALRPADHQQRRQLGLAGDDAGHPRAWRSARCGCATGGASSARELVAGAGAGRDPRRASASCASSSGRRSFGTYGEHYVAGRLHGGAAAWSAWSLFGTLAGSMLPFVLRRLGFDPASASAPFVATLVDVTGLVIYFTVASLILRGTLL